MHPLVAYAHEPSRIVQKQCLPRVLLPRPPPLDCSSCERVREERWAGFIKDYEGGTLMECIINRHIDYLDIPGMIKRQKQCLIEKIKERSSSHIVYEVRAGTVCRPCCVFDCC